MRAASPVLAFALGANPLGGRLKAGHEGLFWDRVDADDQPRRSVALAGALARLAKSGKVNFNLALAGGNR